MCITQTMIWFACFVLEVKFMRCSVLFWWILLNESFLWQCFHRFFVCATLLIAQTQSKPSTAHNSIQSNDGQDESLQELANLYSGVADPSDTFPRPRQSYNEKWSSQDPRGYLGLYRRLARIVLSPQTIWDQYWSGQEQADPVGWRMKKLQEEYSPDYIEKPYARAASSKLRKLRFGRRWGLTGQSYLHIYSMKSYFESPMFPEFMLWLFLLFMLCYMWIIFLIIKLGVLFKYMNIGV